MVFCISQIIFLAVSANARSFRYTHSVFSAVDTIRNVEFAQAEWLNNPIALLSGYNIHEGEAIAENRPLCMDLFLPRGDTLTQRPAIIFVHGGAFLVGSRYNEDMTAFCDSFARRGYVTATIDYRRGMGATVTRFLGITVGISVTQTNGFRAVYRATLDGRAAVRYLRQNAALYGIDSTKIFMVGSSAGAFVALNNLYLDKSHEIPAEAWTDPVLGELDPDGVPGYNSRADAVVALWGAVANTSLIENESTPVLLVHGKEDDIVPFAKGVPLEGSVSPNPFIQLSLPETFGSYCIDTALTGKGIYHETWFPDHLKHEFYGADTGEFPPDGPNPYWDTIQHKIEKFLFYRFRPEADFEIAVNGMRLSASSLSAETHYLHWDFGDGNSGSGKQAEHLYQYPGEYNVTLTVCNGNLACDTLTKTVMIMDTATANPVPSDHGSITIYPNPTSRKLHFSAIHSPFDVNIYDMTGKGIMGICRFDGDKLDVSSLKPGIYLLEIQTGEVTVFKKFIKTD